MFQKSLLQFSVSCLAYLAFCKATMLRRMTDKCLATMDAEIVGWQRLLRHPQLHLSPSTLRLSKISSVKSYVDQKLKLALLACTWTIS